MAKKVRHVRGRVGTSGCGKSVRSPKNPRWLREGRYPPGRLKVYPLQPGEKEGCIYIAQNAEGDVKIGFAFCALSRLRTLNMRERIALRLIRAVKMERRSALLAELLAHKTLADRVSSKFHMEAAEWYEVSPSYASRVVNGTIAAVVAARKVVGNRVTLRHVRRHIRH